jgi:hypothetical protein
MAAVHTAAGFSDIRVEFRIASNRHIDSAFAAGRTVAGDQKLSKRLELFGFGFSSRVFLLPQGQRRWGFLADFLSPKPDGVEPAPANHAVIDLILGKASAVNM